jgi:tetratricopeptide (TPR) repeat protein
MMKIFNGIAISAVLLVLIEGLVHAAGRSQIDQVSEITGIEHNRVAQLVELQDAVSRAAIYSRAGKYDEAVSEVKKISSGAGFKEDDVKRAKVTLFQIHKRAGHYEEAREVGEDLMRYHPIYELRHDEARALLSCQQGSCDRELIRRFVEDYYEWKKGGLPPKGHDLMALAVLIRLYEAAGDIDQAFELVEKYHDHYFSRRILKHQNNIINNKRKGLKLLKEALLRDKAEVKNHYAQELINTTDYFGFV